MEAIVMGARERAAVGISEGSDVDGLFRIVAADP
jgi:hypothetical protein